ncbi:MAG: baeRF7 domain-containing protein [Desulfobacterales bacterium]
MKNFTMEDLKRLMGVENDVCISIYMPTDRAAATTDEQRIRFKNLLRRAEKTVQERAPKNKHLAEMIEKGRRLLDNDYFWRYQSDGLAVFIAPDVFLFYRLPIAFDEVFSASNRFAVKPLMPMFMADTRFYILALSQAGVRLFSCTSHSVVEIELVDVPNGIAESLQYDSKHYQLQFHTGTAGGNRRPAMFHGHGVGTDGKKDEILRYFRDVNQGLAAILSDKQTPLVLAGVGYLLPIFREATSYRWVLEEAVIGNPDGLRAEELHQMALPLVRPVLEQSQKDDERRYRELAGKGYTASGVQAVVPAAVNGRVEALFVALDERRPGLFDKKSNRVTIADEDDPAVEDLLDLAAVETIKNGGRVYATENDRMPEAHAAIAAILRY